MNANLEKFAELVVGRRDVPTVCARVALGIIGPALLLGYGIHCVFTRRAILPSRHALVEINGLSAVAVGSAYILGSVAAYVYICWDDHPRLGGVRDSLAQLLLIAAAFSLAAAFGLAFL